MTRYFIGLLVPPQIHPHLETFRAAIQDRLPEHHDYKISWTAPDDLHCTLLFIGLSDDKNQLSSAMQQMASQLEPVTVTLEGATHWLGRNSLALAATGAEELGTRVVEELGHLSGDRRAGQRRFYGHVTLGRVRPVPARDADPFLGHRIGPISWRATSMYLMQTRPDTTASTRYQIVAQAPLG